VIFFLSETIPIPPSTQAGRRGAYALRGFNIELFWGISFVSKRRMIDIAKDLHFILQAKPLKLSHFLSIFLQSVQKLLQRHQKKKNSPKTIWVSRNAKNCTDFKKLIRV